MISREQIQELIERSSNENQILSAFLDMSVNSDNKRTYQLFLNKQKASYQELDSDRPNHHREAIGEAFARLERWIETNFDQSNKGLAVYIEIDGDWIHGLQLPLPVENRLVVDPRPVVGPLVEIVESYHHHGVVVVDRERLRLLSLYLDQTLAEREVTTEPYPAPHDVRRGGFSAKDFQKRKEEEMRHFFREFADEVAAFVRRYQPDDLILLGTQENVKKFSDFLPDSLRSMVVHTDRVEIDATAAQIRDKLSPVFRNWAEEDEARAVDLLRERVNQNHRAVAGFDETLERLQEGKLETMIIARRVDRQGARCDQCGFLLARTEGRCPYCGGDISDGLDMVEEMVRIAGDQKVRIEFVDASTLDGLGGVGGLLRF